MVFTLTPLAQAQFVCVSQEFPQLAECNCAKSVVECLHYDGAIAFCIMTVPGHSYVKSIRLSRYPVPEPLRGGLPQLALRLLFVVLNRHALK